MEYRKANLRMALIRLLLIVCGASCAASADATTLSCDPGAYDNHIGISGADLVLDGTPTINVGSHNGDVLISSRVLVGKGKSLTIATPGRIVLDGEIDVDDGGVVILNGASVDQIRCSPDYAVCSGKNGNSLGVGGTGTLELSVGAGGAGVNSCPKTEFVLRDLMRTQLVLRSPAATACLWVAKQTFKHQRMEFDTQIYEPGFLGLPGTTYTNAQVGQVRLTDIKVGPDVAVCGR